jgi:hypothetical protein
VLLLSANTKLTFDHCKLRFFSSLEVVRYLATYGCDISASNPRGSTPLMFAAFNHHWEVLSLLVQKGADYQCRDTYNQHIFMMTKDPLKTVKTVQKGLDDRREFEGVRVADSALLKYYANRFKTKKSEYCLCSHVTCHSLNDQCTSSSLF